MTEQRPEVPLDPTAESAAAARVLSDDEQRRARDRIRKRKARKADKQRAPGGPRGASKPAAEPRAPDRVPDRASSVAGADASPLEAAVAAERSSSSSTAPQPAPAIPDAAALANILAQGGAYAAALAAQLEERAPRLARVVRSVQWGELRERDGQPCVVPTASTLLACELAFPWVQQQGLDKLTDLPPGLAAAAGACILFGPVALKAWEEWSAARAIAARQVVQVTPAPADQAKAAAK